MQLECLKLEHFDEGLRAIKYDEFAYSTNTCTWADVSIDILHQFLTSDNLDPGANAKF